MIATRPYITVAVLLVSAVGSGCGGSAPEAVLQRDQDADIVQVAEPLMKIVQETQDPDAKWRAIRALGHLGYSRAAPLLMDCLADDHPYVRANAARALGDMRVAAAAAPLLTLLESETDGGVIEQASLALRNLDVRDAVPLLKQKADHESRQTRIWVLQAIGDLGSREDVPFLAARLDAADLSEQAAAARSIEKIAGVDFGFEPPEGPHNPQPKVSRARAWWNENRTTFVEE